MSLIAICLGREKYTPPAGVFRQITTPVTRREIAGTFRQQIIGMAEEQEEITSSEVCEQLKLTYAQGIYHIRKLVQDGHLIKHDERLIDGSYICFYSIPNHAG